MRSGLTKASSFEVKEWIDGIVELTPYQKSKLDAETIRLSPFWFYKRKYKTVYSPLWRVTLLIYPLYWLIAFTLLPIAFLITGRWGYGRNFIDKFHIPWIERLGL